MNGKLYGSSMEWQVAAQSTKCKNRLLNSDTICQDSNYCLKHKDFVGLAVADGAGASRLSHIGAELSAKTVCLFLAKKFDSIYHSEALSAKNKIINSIRRSIKACAEKENALLEDFATTVLFVAIKSDRIICGHIGDGLILFKAGGIINVLSEPENGEYSNLTYFVTTASCQPHFRIYKGATSKIDAVYLMTDGLSNFIFSQVSKKISPKFIQSLKDIICDNDNNLAKSIENYIEANFSFIARDDLTLGILTK